jgi:hypothetical protein
MGNLRLVDQNSIIQFIENTIEGQDILFLWENDLSDPGKAKFYSIRLHKILPNNTIEILLMSSSSNEINHLTKSKSLKIKHTETGLFFKSLLKFHKNGTLTIPIPKLLNFSNTRGNTRNNIDTEHRVKFSGQKEASYGEDFKLTGNILDFHFNGMAVQLNNQYVSQLTQGEKLIITQIDNEHLQIPIVAEVRFISKEKIKVNDVKQICFKVGLFIKEKLPAKTIFKLSKYKSKQAS